MVVYIYIKYNTQVIYCMDELTEMSLEIQKKIPVIEEKIKYYQEQVVGAEMEFKEMLSTKAYHEQNDTMEEWQRKCREAQSALKDSNTNLNSEKRMLGILKAKLESGNYEMTSTSYAVKRKTSS